MTAPTEGPAPRAAEQGAVELPDVWLVWSNEHDAWWGPNRSGYPANLLGAGTYTRAEAEDCARTRCSPASARAVSLAVLVQEWTRPNTVGAALLARLRAAAAENRTLRRLLWLRHGCPTEAQYGDDGEMQCQCSVADFKRTPADKIERIWQDAAMLALAARSRPTLTADRQEAADA